MLMERTAERSHLIVDQINPICLRIRIKLEKAKLESRCCNSRMTKGNNFEVQVFDKRFVIDLAGKT